MYKKNTVMSAISYCLFVLLFLFTIVQGQQDVIDVCDFDGILPDTSQWEASEFSILLKDKRSPGYLIMTRILGEFAITDSNTLKSPSCKVSKYVEALIQFYDKNTTAIQSKHKNLADLLDLIRDKIKNQ